MKFIWKREAKEKGEKLEERIIHSCCGRGGSYSGAFFLCFFLTGIREGD